MRGRRVILAGVAATAVGLAVAGPAAAQQEQGWAVRASLTNPDVPLYNTAKQKLLDGGQVFTYTIASRDTEFYCEVAPHYDFIFFEMQHSTMSWADVEAMIAALLGAANRSDFESAVRALDRVLSAGIYVIPFGYLPTDRVAWQKDYARPERDALYGWRPEVWWKAAE